MSNVSSCIKLMAGPSLPKLSSFCGDKYSLWYSSSSSAPCRARAYATHPPVELQHQQLTHVDESGQAAMVDVGGKNVTRRVARASARVLLGAEVFELVRSNSLKKGDVLTVAKLAGIMGCKHTSTLIPLCHTLLIDKAEVELSLDDDAFAVNIVSCVSCTGKTGVEMEALTAASIAALTVYDMCKAASHDITISEVKLLEKRGGRSDFVRSDAS